MKKIVRKLHKFITVSLCCVLVFETVKVSGFAVFAEENQNYQTVSGNATETVSGNVVESENVVEEYKITYVNVSNSEIPNAVETYTAADEVVLPRISTRANRIFTGWYLDEGLTTRVGNVISRGTTGDITLYPGFDYADVGLYLLKERSDKAAGEPNFEVTSYNCIDYDESEYIRIGTARFTLAYDPAYRTYAEIQDKLATGYDSDKNKVESLIVSYKIVETSAFQYDAENGTITYQEDGVTYTTTFDNINWYVIKHVKDAENGYAKFNIDGVTFWDADEEEETPVVPGDGEEEETPVVPGDGEEEETPVVPGDGEEEETPVVPDDGEEEETPVVPGDGEEEETPAVPGDGEEEETPAVPGDGEEEETPVVPGDGEEEETPAVPGDGEEEETPVVPGDSEEQETPVVPGDSEEQETPVTPNVIDNDDEEEVVPAVAEPLTTTVVPVAPTPAVTTPVAENEDADVQIEEEEAPLAAEIEELDNDDADSEQNDGEVTVIEDEETPLAAKGHCWIHWLILILTVIYTAFELIRCMNRNKKINELKDDLQEDLV